MGWFDGFPFTSKEDRERKRKEFEKRVVPFGAEAQREKLRELLLELFPGIDPTDAMFAFFDAKDAYTKKETKEEGYEAAKLRLNRIKWLDRKTLLIMLRLIELESEIKSLDDYPAAKDVLAGLYGEE